MVPHWLQCQQWRRLQRWLAVVSVVCLALAASLVQAAAPSPVVVPPDADWIPLWPSIQVIASQGRDLTPAQAADLATGSEAFTVNSPNRILGRAMSPYWGRFSLHNPAPVNVSRLLTLETTTQFDIRLYHRDERGIWQLVRSIADQAEGRVGGGTTHPVWSLTLNAQQSADYLLRIEGPAIVRFPVFLHSYMRFADGQRMFHLAIGVALGICCLMVIHIGSLRRYFNDRAVLLFLYVVLADLMGALWLCGFLDELFPALPQRTLSLIGTFAYCSMFGCGTLHARIYLNTAAWAPRIDRQLQALGGIWIIAALLSSPLFPAASRIAMVWGGAATALILVCISLVAARRRLQFSRYIAAAWVAYLVGASSFLVARLGDDPMIWTSSSLILAQATIVAVLFGLAMSQRLLKQRDALVTAHQDAIASQVTTAALGRERSLLFAATNHDLRQPLLGMGLFTELLASATTQKERDAYALKLGQAMHEVDELVIGIQQLAAVHEGGHQLAFETVKLDDVLLPIIEEYRGRAAYKQLTIRYVPTRLSITTHVPYFQRIVRNVLSNAVRYTEQGDRILVGCRRAGGAHLIIQDTGHGMSKEQTQLAFGAFLRFDTAAWIPDGFGLGLFSVLTLAKVLGMTPALDSGHSGDSGRCGDHRGTRFSLHFSAPGSTG
jgi:signal transduction histidine kinase